MRVKIEVDTATFVRFLLVVSAFVLTIFFVWKLSSVLLIILVSFFLAIAFNKPVSGLSRHLPGHSRVLATALSYVVLVAVIGLFLFVAVPPIISQTTLFISSIPGYFEQLSQSRGLVAELANRYQLHDEINAFVQGVQDQAGSIAQGVGSNVVAGVSSVFSGFITLLTVLVLTFLMLIEGPKWQQRLWEVYTDKSKMERHKRLVNRMYRVVTGYVNGQVLVATIAATMAATALLILSSIFNVPSTAILPLAVVVLFTSLIPMIGATIGATIVLIVLLFNDVGAALIFLIYFLIYQQIENNIIQPTVQSKTVELSALMVFIAAIVGVVLLGVVGGILAIPFAGCLRVLILDYIEHRHKKIDKRLKKSIL